MRRVEQILEHNQAFVEGKEYEQYLPQKRQEKRVVIVSCMDTRLTELLPKAFDVQSGDAKIVKVAGAIITAPFGNVMRSILISLYELNANEVIVCGHYDCGMTGIDPKVVVGHMIERGIPEDVIRTLSHSGISFERWLTGFDDVRSSVENSVDVVRKHPLLPPETPVHGMIIDPKTGKLDWVVDGYDYLGNNAGSNV
jgi:carbonic anhydrase